MCTPIYIQYVGVMQSACCCLDLTKASLNCQKVGFMRSLTEEGSTARRVQAVLKNNSNVQSDHLAIQTMQIPRGRIVQQKK